MIMTRSCFGTFLFVFVTLLGGRNNNNNNGVVVVVAFTPVVPVLTPDTLHIAETTIQTIIQASHVDDIFNAYKETLHQYPLPTKMITGGTLSVAGDAIAQSNGLSKQYDVRRAASFAAFDMTYRALQHVSFPIITGSCHGQFIGSVASALSVSSLVDVHSAATMEQTLASQLIIVPFLYYPAFFTLTAAIQGLDLDGAIQRAKETFVPLMQRNLLFWIPVQFVQFGYIEESLQIPFLAVCGLMWTIILSTFAGSAKKYTSTAQAQTASTSTAVPPTYIPPSFEEQYASTKVTVTASGRSRSLLRSEV